MAKKILVIDDEEDICEMIKVLLESEGYEVECGYDGKECLEKVKNNGFGLILLDIFMPDISGEQVLKLLRKEGNKIPIIFVSIKEREEVDLSKAQGFVQKPFKNKDLLSLVKQSIEV